MLLSSKTTIGATVIAMKSRMKGFAFISIVSLSGSLSVRADDTDIYRNLDALNQSDVRPNVLLMLDTSHSMEEAVAGGDNPPPGGSRIEVMRGVVNGLLAKESLRGKVNIGLGRFNSITGSIIHPVVELTADNAAILTERVNNHMTPAGATPLVPSFYESTLYMRGLAVDGGLSRGNVSSDWENYGYKKHLRISHGSTMENEVWVSSDDCDGQDSDDADCETESWSGDPVYTSPITDQCQPNHIVVLSDGEANSNGVVGAIESLTGSTCAGSGNLKCAIELAAYLKTNDLFVDETAFGTPAGGVEAFQTITTHTVAFAEQYPELEAIAAAGGGSYSSPADGDELAATFSAMFDDFIETDATFSAPSATVNQFNRLNHLDHIYFALFHPENKVAWPGNVKKYKLATGTVDDGGTPGDESDDVVVTSNTIVDKYDRPAIDSDDGFFLPGSIDFWSSKTAAGVQAAIEAGDDPEFSVTEGGILNQILDTPTDGTRRIYTYFDGSRRDVSSTNDDITKAMLGIDGEDDSYWDDLRDWMAGIDVMDWDGNGNTSEYRKQMGDPLHSRPTVVTYGGTNANPILKMFFGTNDGYFRVVDANTGAEEFSFIPEEMLGDMDARRRNPTGTHFYGVDGAPTVWIKDDNNNGIIETSGDPDGDGVDEDDHVYVYFGFRRGGTSYYALDVTNLNDPQFLWRIENTGDFSEMGQTWSKPIKTKLFYDLDDDPDVFDPGEVDVLIFAGGYDTNQDDIDTNIHRRTTDDQGRAVYVVRADTGALLWKMEQSSNADMAYSIPATMSVIDPDLSGHADQMYVGDMGGQVWRFDIDSGADWVGSGMLPSDFITGQVVADLATDGNNANARRFYQSPDVAITKELDGDDVVEKIALTIGSGYRARPNETGVQDRFYMIKLPNPYTPLGSFISLGHGDLLPVTNELDPTFLDSHYGWYIDLEGTGEKVLSTPLIVDGKVIFTTYEPTARLVGCTAQPGISREYVVNLLDASPVFNHGGNLTKDDRKRELNTGTIVDEPVIIFTEDGGGTTFLGTEQGSYGITSNRATRTFWFEKE